MHCMHAQTMHTQAIHTQTIHTQNTTRCIKNNQISESTHFSGQSVCTSLNWEHSDAWSQQKMFDVFWLKQGMSENSWHCPASSWPVRSSTATVAQQSLVLFSARTNAIWSLFWYTPTRSNLWFRSTHYKEVNTDSTTPADEKSKPSYFFLQVLDYSGLSPPLYHHITTYLMEQRLQFQIHCNCATAQCSSLHKFA